ncbi:MAG TPA: recombination regulator RecX [Legionellaceae bacterium]|nr:recombination regulator RecX [Legionellaceae bacterium]
MTNVLAAAVAILARREHSAGELTQKLMQKGFDPAAISHAITTCQQQGLQSDIRFVEMILHARIRQGYGLERIRYELRQKQVDPGILDQLLASEPIDWVAQAHQVLHKKYKSLQVDNFQQRQKQKQFLLYRGFANSIISQVFEQIE